MKNKILECTFQGRRYVINIDKISHLIENEQNTVIHLDNGNTIQSNIDLDSLIEKIGWSK